MRHRERVIQVLNLQDEVDDFEDVRVYATVVTKSLRHRALIFSFRKTRETYEVRA